MSTGAFGTESDSNSPAWYDASRPAFVAERSADIANKLNARATMLRLETPPEQFEEWRKSVEVLQHPLANVEEAHERVRVVRRAVHNVPAVRDVLLEFDFRRRGLRIDCVLLAEGVLFIVEFKRTRITGADRDQVMSYAINLLEFHRVTREWAERGALVVPVLVLTAGNCSPSSKLPPVAPAPWNTLVSRPLTCAGSEGLQQVLELALAARRNTTACNREVWLASPFSPSSTMIDAALSLYGQHDVAAIEDHAAPKEAIDRATAEVVELIDNALAAGEHRVVFLSGAPGAGKTLVGLGLAFHRKHGKQTVFVTGNAPLVDVLKKALEYSYGRQIEGKKNRGLHIPTGFPKKDYLAASTYKIVKAHQFLGVLGEPHRQEDGRVLVFDEAQRTFEKGHRVQGVPLPEDEALLILRAQEEQFPNGSVIVALIGHNQFINSGERGMRAWFEAAERSGWKVSVARETLDLLPNDEAQRWEKRSDPMKFGHLHQSMRFYRNKEVEQWASALLDGKPEDAAECAETLRAQGVAIRFTRDLNQAREWAKKCATAGQRCGMIASAWARRLAAYGLFVDLKPDIADWMLAPSSDFRSSNSLETVQKHFQVQGLEVDFAIVCWDLDLRREGREWKACRLSGAKWTRRDSELEITKNSYRVLLTRARKGMVIFVPRGDETGEDETRPADVYDAIAASLKAAGAMPLEGGL